MASVAQWTRLAGNNFRALPYLFQTINQSAWHLYKLPDENWFTKDVQWLGGHPWDRERRGYWNRSASPSVWSLPLSSSKCQRIVTSLLRTQDSNNIINIRWWDFVNQVTHATCNLGLCHVSLATCDMPPWCESGYSKLDSYYRLKCLSILSFEYIPSCVFKQFIQGVHIRMCWDCLSV